MSPGCASNAPAPPRALPERRGTGSARGARRTCVAGVPAARTANLDGRLQLQQDRLADQNLARLVAQKLDLIFLQLHLLARSTSADCRTTPRSGGDRGAERGANACMVRRRPRIDSESGAGRGQRLADRAGLLGRTFKQARDDAVDVDRCLARHLRGRIESSPRWAKNAGDRAPMRQCNRCPGRFRRRKRPDGACDEAQRALWVAGPGGAAPSCDSVCGTTNPARKCVSHRGRKVARWFVFMTKCGGRRGGAGSVRAARGCPCHPSSSRVVTHLTRKPRSCSVQLRAPRLRMAPRSPAIRAPMSSPVRATRAGRRSPEKSSGRVACLTVGPGRFRGHVQITCPA